MPEVYGADIGSRTEAPADPDSLGDSQSMIALLKGMLLQLSAVADGSPLQAGEQYIGQVGGKTFGPVSVRKQRPANTTDYTANAAIAEATTGATGWVFPVARVVGGSGFVLHAHIEFSMTTSTARFEVDLYTVSPAAINDNVEATRLTANGPNFLQTITFPAVAKKTASSTIAEADVDVRIPFKCVGSANLFGIVRTLDAITTPTSAATVTINLSGIQD